MNPQKRFGQLEEVMSEMLQKQDRIEDLATKTFSLAETAHTNGETTARAVANLTIENQQAHQQMNQKLDVVQEQMNQKLDVVQEQMKQELNEVRDDVKEIMVV
jgi:hypothetical protein